MHTNHVKSLLLLGVSSALFSTPVVTLAQGITVATTRAVVRPATVARGSGGTLLVTLTVSPGFHVNAVKPNDPALIPTVFTGHAPKGILFGPAHYPASKSMRVSYENKPMLVYTGTTAISVPFTVTKTAKSGPVQLLGTVNYQGCNATSCYPPTSASVHASVTVR